ncbi:hypothetical protein B0H63DRAFT_543886 [Podospora didyma]|uniref:Uncharacterized protein n=1 Tax=Podospora didyma TaxID=330526 RepID=A0AAE0TZY0_9PEZI|nr:hypothetical protein B0H63DRAFT_543886 [Podospora didyma]
MLDIQTDQGRRSSSHRQHVELFFLRGCSFASVVFPTLSTEGHWVRAFEDLWLVFDLLVDWAFGIPADDDGLAKDRSEHSAQCNHHVLPTPTHDNPAPVNDDAPLRMVQMQTWSASIILRSIFQALRSEVAILRRDFQGDMKNIFNSLMPMSNSLETVSNAVTTDGNMSAATHDWMVPLHQELDTLRRNAEQARENNQAILDNCLEKHLNAIAERFDAKFKEIETMQKDNAKRCDTIIKTQGEHKRKLNNLQESIESVNKRAKILQEKAEDSRIVINNIQTVTNNIEEYTAQGKAHATK